MIVPEFWAEARVQQPRREGEGQITVRRFGWSDVSPADAQRMAEERAQAALERIRRGERLVRREPRVPYNGAEGVPIREEVLERHGEVVITRNSYGARCLNTPDVLFADVDFDTAPAGRTVAGCAAGLVVLAIAGGIWLQSWKVGLAAAFLALVLAFPLAHGLQRAGTALQGGAVSATRRRIEAAVRRRPGWQVRLYRTPAGWRVLAVHGVFDPRSTDVAEFFRAIRVDPVYARMCVRQACFRARLTAKPWRIGLEHIRPRPGVWPVNPARRPERLSWVQRYEQAAAGFAACRFEEILGDGATHVKAAGVGALHDQLSRATSGREIA